MLRAVGGGGGGDGAGAGALLRVWVALEARQFFANSVGEIEKCVKYDLLSPNI